MPRLKTEKRSELESFWRFHHEEWQKSTLNQREYCEFHGLPLKRFGNWRVQFRHEATAVKARLLYRRGGSGPRTSPRTDRESGAVSPGYIPSARSTPEARRNFTDLDKKRIVAEATRPGASVSDVARRHGIASALLFRWRKDAQREGQPQASFLSVTLEEAPGSITPASPALPIIVERPVQEIEVELRGGRRVRFARDVDPETVRTLVALLEGAVS